MSKRLDYKLGFFTRRKSVKGDIGIEVELEGGANLKILPQIPKYWAAKPENSLRNGMEYVLKTPVPIKDLPLALDEFKQSMAASKPLKTIRCSTHVHVNVLDKTVREIYNILAYYFLVEDILVRTQGHVRMGNLFCLRMSDAEGMGSSIRESIVSQNYFRHFGMNHFKYGAVNLAAPAKFGSLEFRFLRPITDHELLKFWCELFYEMIQNASKLSIEDTVSNAQTLSPKAFLKLVWSDEVVDFLTTDYQSSESISESILNNLDHVISISKAMKKITREIIPAALVENDSIEVPEFLSEENETHFEDEEFIPVDDVDSADEDPIAAPVGGLGFWNQILTPAQMEGIQNLQGADWHHQQNMAHLPSLEQGNPFFPETENGN